MNMQVKVVGKASYAGSFLGYDEYVPMVDKAVDACWKKQALIQKPHPSKGFIAVLHNMLFEFVNALYVPIIVKLSVILSLPSAKR